jgi:hypothetical protein
MNKEIITKNNKNQYHGYNQLYIDDWNKLLYRANFKNGNIIGYLENHNIKQTIFHIK